jgi:hypothetical protein
MMTAAIGVAFATMNVIAIPLQSVSSHTGQSEDTTSILLVTMIDDNLFFYNYDDKQNVTI